MTKKQANKIMKSKGTLVVSKKKIKVDKTSKIVKQPITKPIQQKEIKFQKITNEKKR